MKKRAILNDIADLVGEIDESVLDSTISEFEKDFSKELDSFEDAYVGDLEKTFDGMEESSSEFLSDLKEEHGPSAKIRTLIPGSEAFLEDEDEGEIKEKSYEEGDLSKFPEYLGRMYQNIPRHSGDSIAGCERAVSYLGKLDQEISRNIREDAEHTLDIDEMSKYQQQILKDVVILKEHMKKLKRQMREGATEKKASVEKSEDIVKEASLPKVQLVVTPFIRAICGILVNSVVSAGKPFEKVYDYLCKKYKINDREELEIFQTLLDMGLPIFKDRGSISAKSLSAAEEKELSKMEEELSGVDFITNYFG